MGFEPVPWPSLKGLGLGRPICRPKFKPQPKDQAYQAWVAQKPIDRSKRPGGSGASHVSGFDEAYNVVSMWCLHPIGTRQAYCGGILCVFPS